MNRIEILQFTPRFDLFAFKFNKHQIGLLISLQSKID